MNKEKENLEVDEKENRSVLKKASDVFEDFIDDVEEIVYHPEDGITKDVPASIEGPEHRIFLKHETRRNLNKKIFGHKWVYITFAVIFALGILGLILTFIIKNALL